MSTYVEGGCEDYCWHMSSVYDVRGVHEMMAIIIMGCGQEQWVDQSGWGKGKHIEFEESSRNQIME